MYNSTDTILENGEPALFGLYQHNFDFNNYQLKAFHFWHEQAFEKLNFIS